MKPKNDYYENGNIFYETYWVNHKRHRLDGPAVIVYYENGNKHIEKYFVNDLYHRLDGPAYISYWKDGDIYIKEYFVNGIKIPKEEIDEILKECDNDKQMFIDLLTIRYS